MKKAIITTSEAKKLKAINNLDKNVLIVLPTASKAILEKITVPHSAIFSENLSKAVSFLDFQTKVNDDVVLIVFDCLRYGEYNNTKYNKIYLLSGAAKNCIIIDSFPFVFDHRNLWVIQKILGIEKYHPKQFYDDNFYIEQDGKNIKANSIDAIYSNLEPYIFTDITKLEYEVHAWQHTAEENDLYEARKHRNIYEREYSKMKVVTSLQGFSNRFDTKFQTMLSVLKGIKCKPLIFYNWDEGIKQHKPKIAHIVDMASYHQKTEDTNCDVLFFETIISQKIQFYDKLKQYTKSKLHFFVNPKLGADKIVVNETIEIVKQLNAFAAYEWKKI